MYGRGMTKYYTLRTERGMRVLRYEGPTTAADPYKLRPQTVRFPRNEPGLMDTMVDALERAGYRYVQ